MPNRQYNLNTKYGRRKAREQARENLSKLPQEEQDKYQMIGCVIMVIIGVVIGGLILFLSGPDALLKWLTR
ncbi:MAG: hypothetical protein ACTHMM_18235 [Agriterribacter sp.]